MCDCTWLHWSIIKSSESRNYISSSVHVTIVFVCVEYKFALVFELSHSVDGFLKVSGLSLELIDLLKQV